MIELRTSERGAFKRCPQRHAWGYVEGLAPARAANPLWFGQAVHIALAEWYLKGLKRGPHPAETFASVLEGDRAIRIPSDSDELEAEYIDAKALGIAMLENYVKKFGRDSNWHVISTEQKFEYWIPALGKKRGRDIRYLGTFDGVYRDLETGFLWLMEHKTAAGINLSHLPLDQQASSYWAVALKTLKRMGAIKPGDHIEGIMFNFLRKQTEDGRPKNADGHYTNKPTKEHYLAALAEAGIPIPRGTLVKDLGELCKVAGLKVLGDVSKSQPPPLFERYPVFRTPEERRTQILRVQKDAWHIDQARNNPGYPIIKNPTKDCSWDCPFFAMCELDEQGDEESVQDFKEAVFVKRDPYADHRKSA